MKVKTLHLETVKMKTSNFLECLLKSQNNLSTFQSLPIPAEKERGETTLFITSDPSSVHSHSFLTLIKKIKAFFPQLMYYSEKNTFPFY